MTDDPKIAEDPEDQQPILRRRRRSSVESSVREFHENETFTGEFSIVQAEEVECNSDVGSEHSDYLETAEDENGGFFASKFVQKCLRWALVIVVLFMYAAFPMGQHWAFSVVSVTLDYTDSGGTTQEDFFRERDWTYRDRMKRISFHRPQNVVEEDENNSKFVWGEQVKRGEERQFPDTTWDNKKRHWKGWVKSPVSRTYLFGLVLEGAHSGGFVRVGDKRSEIDPKDDLGIALSDRSSGVIEFDLSGKYVDFEVEITLGDNNEKLGFFYVPKGQPNFLHYGDEKLARAQPVALSVFVPGQFEEIERMVPPLDLKMENAKDHLIFVFTTSIVAFKIIIVFATLLIVMFLGWRKGKLKEEFWACVDPVNIWRAAPIALTQTMADVGRFLAVGGMDPVTYLVLGKSEVILTPIVSTIVLKKRYTLLRWQLIVVLTFTILAFSADQNFTQGDQPFLFVMVTLMKVCFSVASNILSERRFRKSDLSFMTILVNINILSLPIAGLLVLIIGWIKPEFSVFIYGFFGGKEFGWDVRTIFVVIFASLVQCLVLLVVKLYSAVVKTFVSASVPALSYLLQVMMGTKFVSITKLCLVFAIGVVLATFSMAREYMKTTVSEIDPNDKHRGRIQTPTSKRATY